MRQRVRACVCLAVCLSLKVCVCVMQRWTSWPHALHMHCPRCLMFTLQLKRSVWVALSERRMSACS